MNRIVKTGKDTWEAFTPRPDSYLVAKVRRTEPGESGLFVATYPGRPSVGEVHFQHWDDVVEAIAPTVDGYFYAPRIPKLPDGFSIKPRGTDFEVVKEYR